MFATRTRCLLAIAALSLGATAAGAATVNWDGHDWDTSFGSAAVDGNNFFEITATTHSSDGNFYGDAHYNTDAAFRAASAPYLQATFRDPGGTGNAGYLAFEQESGAGKSWAEIGVDRSNDGTGANYSLYWWNETTNVTDEVTLAPRTAGDHTFTLSRRADKTVDFYLDGSLVQSTNGIAPDYFGDVYLFSVSGTSGSVATFTDFVAGTDFAPAPAAPLPNSAAAALLLAGLVTTHKLRRRRRPILV